MRLNKSHLIISPEQQEKRLMKFIEKTSRAKQLKDAYFICRGKCPECEGSGEVGGQFSGGGEMCIDCNGTGIYTP